MQRLIIFALSLQLNLALASAQVTKAPPPVGKSGIKLVKLPDLAITDLFYGDTPTSVYVQIGNIGNGDSSFFTVRLSVKGGNETTATYVEKMVSGIKSKNDSGVNIEIGREVKGLDIGVFIDSKKAIKESNENNNCGRLDPSGGTQGNMSCEKF